MRQLESFDAKDEYLSAKRISKDYRITRLDPSFQRLGGPENGSGWPIADGEEYLAGFLCGGTANSVIRADVAACLKYAEELARDNPSDKKSRENLEYWEELASDNWVYLSIDGNNTCGAISAFVNGYKDESGKVKYLAAYDKHGIEEKYTERYYLHDQDQTNPDVEDFVDNLLNEEKIHALTLRKITYKQVCRLFRKLNKSTHLNAQEYRQAIPSPRCKFIRDISNTYRNSFLLYLGGGIADYHKRLHEEFTAKIYLRIMQPQEMNGKLRLDKMYEEDWNSDQKVEKQIKELFEALGSLTDAIEGVNKTQAKPRPKFRLAEFTILCGLLQSMAQDNIIIKDFVSFGDWFLREHVRFKAAAEKVPGDEHYNEWMRLVGKPSNYYSCCILFERSLSEVLANFESEGIVEFSPERTSRDLFTFDDKLKLYHLQEGTTRDGKEIDIYDIYRGIYHADHVKSFKDGGRTGISNGELMTKENNLKKGASSNETHFDFQEGVPAPPQIASSRSEEVTREYNQQEGVQNEALGEQV